MAVMHDGLTKLQHGGQDMIHHLISRPMHCNSFICPRLPPKRTPGTVAFSPEVRIYPQKGTDHHQGENICVGEGDGALLLLFAVINAHSPQKGPAVGRTSACVGASACTVRGAARGAVRGAVRGS